MARSPLPQIDYSARDWESLRLSIFDYLARKFPNDWTDFAESSVGTALIEAMLYMYENLSFAMDRAVNENFITTARDRQSVIRLAALLGYKLSAATASSVNLTITTNDLLKLASPINISAGAKISAGDVVFEVDKNYVITKNNGGLNLWSVNGGPQLPTATIGARQGEISSDTFVSEGSKNQTYKTSRRPYIDKSVYVEVSGIRWKMVDSLVLGDPVNQSNQNIYEIQLDKDDNLSVIFGDGIAGNIPTEGETIVIYQRIGGGERGNVASGSISGSIACTANGVTSTVKVQNYEPASGGSDRETTEHAKLFAPL